MLCDCVALLVAADLPTITSQAAAAPPPDAPPPPATVVEGVVVTGDRPEAASLIDRQVYSLRDDPQAQTSPMIDVLGKVPSVTVTPAGRIYLLGSPGVTVLIDGKAPANLEVALRTLTGSDVDRVEVMTNPSAQFRPDGVAGVINIITRKHRRPGMTGSVLSSADNLGGAQLHVSPTLTIGKWSLSGSLGFDRNRTSGAVLTELTELDGAGAVVSTRLQDRRSTSLGDQVSGSAKVAFRPSDSQSFTLSVDGYSAVGEGRVRTEVSASDPVVPDYIEFSRSPSRVTGGSAGLSYEWSGAKPGESLTISLSTTNSDWRIANRITDDFAVLGLSDQRYDLATVLSDREDSLTFDYVYPFSETAVLSIGAAWDLADNSLREQLVNSTGGSALGPAFDETITGRRKTLSAYATFQFGLGKWTVLPGLRAEDESFDVRSGGASGARDDFTYYPSLHLSRGFGDALSLKISYSKRVDRPGIEQLNPAVRYLSSTEATTGNPQLRPITIDSYEGRLTYSLSGRDVALTVYDRESRDVWSPFTQFTADGVKLTTTVNAGESFSRGAELSLRGPLASRFKYALTANLFYRQIQVLDGGLLRPNAQFTYSGNAQLDYQAPAGLLEGDQLQVAVRYFGPWRSLQGEEDGFFRADLTWRHPLTVKTSLVVTVSDVFDSTTTHSRLTTGQFRNSEDSSGPAPVIKFALSYKLGPGS